MKLKHVISIVSIILAQTIISPILTHAVLPPIEQKPSRAVIVFGGQAPKGDKKRSSALQNTTLPVPLNHIPSAVPHSQVSRTVEAQ